jgi:hypothetical protein
MIDVLFNHHGSFRVMPPLMAPRMCTARGSMKISPALWPSAVITGRVLPTLMARPPIPGAVSISTLACPSGAGQKKNTPNHCDAGDKELSFHDGLLYSGFTGKTCRLLDLLDAGGDKKFTQAEDFPPTVSEACRHRSSGAH